MIRKILHKHQIYLILLNICFTLPFVVSVVNASNKYVNIDVYNYILDKYYNN